MKHFTIRRGAPAPPYNGPSGPIEDATGIKSVAILGDDWPGLRPHMEVEVGTQVRRGQLLFTDRKNREVCFVSPVSGVVDSLTYGARRMLDTLVVRVEGDDVLPVSGIDNADDPRPALLSGGFWTAFRARPFGGIPAPDAEPDTIVVNAVRGAPQAPDPAIVLDDLGDSFHVGCEALTRLTRGNVHICQSPGKPRGPTLDRVKHASFSGTLAAGLSGTQIDRLCPRRSVWSVGYQDVAAMGHYLATGNFRASRVISVTGPMATPPRLVRAPLGSWIADLIDEESVRTMSGGREAVFLGRFDDQITLLPSLAPTRRVSQARKAGHNAAIPSRALENAVAVNVLPLPLLRALSIGDAEAAERLGCLALIEEDLAAATRNCTSGVDYGACLRRVLTDLEAEAA